MIPPHGEKSPAKDELLPGKPAHSGPRGNQRSSSLSSLSKAPLSPVPQTSSSSTRPAPNGLSSLTNMTDVMPAQTRFGRGFLTFLDLPLKNQGRMSMFTQQPP